MAETKHSQEYESGCGLVGAIFQLGGSKGKKASVQVTPADNSKDITTVESESSLNSKGQRGSSSGMGFLQHSASAKPRLKKPLKKPTFVRNQDSKSRDTRRSSMSSFANTSSLISASQVVNAEYTQRLRSEKGTNLHFK